VYFKMAEEKQLSGEEWISDDSSFYGKCSLNAKSVHHRPVLDDN
jgi:hypothetical protein